MPIKWIIFDAMGVVYEVADDVSDLLVPFLRSKNNLIPLKKIIENYINASLGYLTSRQFWEILGYIDEYPEIEKEYLNNWYIINPEFIEIANILKKDYKLGMLSNDLKDWSQFLRTKYNIDKLFEVKVISGEVGFRKPDQTIFEILLKEINSKQEECLFVDDKLENLNAASKLGIKTIRFIGKEFKQKTCSEFEVNSFTELMTVIKNFY